MTGLSIGGDEMQMSGDMMRVTLGTFREPDVDAGRAFLDSLLRNFPECRQGVLQWKSPNPPKQHDGAGSDFIDRLLHGSGAVTARKLFDLRRGHGRMELRFRVLLQVALTSGAIRHAPEDRARDHRTKGKAEHFENLEQIAAVSYTHLTLPTSDLV